MALICHSSRDLLCHEMRDACGERHSLCSECQRSSLVELSQQQRLSLTVGGGTRVSLPFFLCHFVVFIVLREFTMR